MPTNQQRYRQAMEQATFYKNKFFGNQLALPAPEQVTNVSGPFNKARKGTARTVHRMMNDSVTGKFMKKVTIGSGGPRSHGGLLGAATSAKLRVQSKFRGVSQSKVGKAVGTGISLGGKAVKKTVFSKLGVRGMIAMGAAAMVGVGMMRGAMNAAQDIVAERYLQDQRMSRNVLMNTRVGYSMGAAEMNKYGQTNGLAQALHNGRHGRY